MPARLKPPICASCDEEGPLDFRFTPEQEAFRSEVRDFVAREWRGGAATSIADPDGDADWAQQQEFRKALSRKGWLTRAWPSQWGGQDADQVDQAIYREEMALAGAPDADQGVDRVGPSLMLFGNEEQKQRYLPRISRAEIFWCQGFSEPGSGSDLASLQTRAVLDGDSYVVNGQKIWTSNAHRADWVFLLARTDPDAPKHRGISFFLVDMRSPGITVQPLINMAGNHGFNQVFFDNVRVPRQNLVGEENRGWYIAATTLDFERSGINRIAGAVRVLEGLVDHVRKTPSLRSDAIRNRLAELKIEFDLGRMLAYRVAWMQSRKLIPNYEASMSKLFGSEVQQRLANFAINALGLRGQLSSGSAWAPLGGQPEHYYLSTVSLTIAAGTSEVQRNIIATRGLGLPRG
jgi:alkylation response protein AidB-like acyl-CoA dehydrogenase